MDNHTKNARPGYVSEADFLMHVLDLSQSKDESDRVLARFGKSVVVPFVNALEEERLRARNKPEMATDIAYAVASLCVMMIGTTASICEERYREPLTVALIDYIRSTLAADFARRKGE